MSSPFASRMGRWIGGAADETEGAALTFDDRVAPSTASRSPSPLLRNAEVR